MIAAESMLVNTFSFIDSASTAVMTVRFLMLTTIAVSRMMNSEFFAPFAAALSAIAFILATSSFERLMLRDCKRAMACAENLSGSLVEDEDDARSSAERKLSELVGGIWTGCPTGRGPGPGIIADD